MVKYHDLWPVMVLRSPGSKSRDRAIVVRGGADGRPLIHTRAAYGIGPNHIGGWNIEQVDLATEPAVGITATECACSRTVMRDGTSSAKPKARPR